MGTRRALGSPRHGMRRGMPGPRVHTASTRIPLHRSISWWAHGTWPGRVLTPAHSRILARHGHRAGICCGWGTLCMRKRARTRHGSASGRGVPVHGCRMAGWKRTPISSRPRRARMPRSAHRSRSIVTRHLSRVVPRAVRTGRSPMAHRGGRRRGVQAKRAQGLHRVAKAWRQPRSRPKTDVGTRSTLLPMRLSHSHPRRRGRQQTSAGTKPSCHFSLLASQSTMTRWSLHARLRSRIQVREPIRRFYLVNRRKNQKNRLSATADPMVLAADRAGPGSCFWRLQVQQHDCDSALSIGLRSLCSLSPNTHSCTHTDRHISSPKH
jgi:hypothetical protein